MSSEFFSSLFSNAWSLILMVLFFGGSIFVHELGHFLAARWRGVKVTRFAICFGQAIWSRVAKDGVEYRIGWIPLGGYVALPQLADMAAIEGDSEVTERLPPLSYTTKVIVFAAGAFFNVLFAIVLATIVWFVGQPTISYLETTQVGVVQPTLTLPDGKTVPSPAMEAGVLPGDKVISVDGISVNNFDDIMTNILLGHGRSADGRRKCGLVIDREGKTLGLTLYPRLVSDEKVRFIGIEPAEDLSVESVLTGDPAQQAGVRAGDRIVAIDGTPVYLRSTVSDRLTENPKRATEFTFLRDGKEIKIPILPRLTKDERTQKNVYRVGIRYHDPVVIMHPTPYAQIAESAMGMYRSITAILSPGSDIGLSKLSGPIGIAREFHREAQWDFRRVLWFTILININLAIFNLLPIPVLDGGHILFATIGKIRGRALPVNLIATAQSIFIVLLLSMMLYVTVFGDLRRWVSDSRADAETAAAVKDSAKPTPQPAKP